MAGRRYCTLSSAAGECLAQLHCFEASSPHVIRHLAFRDYCGAHPAAADYERKAQGAASAPSDSHAYRDEKSSWVRDVEAKALAWFAQD
jgi:GrpB-like predicted nucleotidyltransferase (UPF0157 family)